jgi:AcrR family transcriptional regulator
MPRPKQFTDEQILQTARRCFLEHGARVSTARIAAEIGLSQAALFKRFQTKENLMISALQIEEEPEWLARVKRGPTPGPIDVQLRAIASEATLFFRALVPRMMVLQSAGIAPEDLLDRFEIPPALRALRYLTTFMRTACEEDRARCTDPAAFAMQFLGGLQGRAFLGHMFRSIHTPTEEEDLHYAHAMVDHLWNGLAPPPPTPPEPR